MTLLLGSVIPLNGVDSPHGPTDAATNGNSRSFSLFFSMYLSRDIFAFSTTNQEGFGIVLIEALSLGIPIVASDVCACREVLMDGKGGILVNPGDLKDWEKVLSKLMNSESERKVLGKKAKEISKHLYFGDWQQLNEHNIIRNPHI